MRRTPPSILRGYILSCLYSAYEKDVAPDPAHPGRLPKVVLERVFEYHGSVPPSGETEKALHYLGSNRDYVRVGWAEDGSGDYRHVEITEKGLDLIQGNAAEDPGVSVSVRRNHA